MIHKREHMTRAEKNALDEAMTIEGLLAVTLAQWQAEPVIEQGHTDNLVFQSTVFRVWVSRMSRRDYAEGDEGARAYALERMTIEKFTGGRWVLLDRYGRER